jgi:Spy/CpxP family protein refolding chaperone
MGQRGDRMGARDHAKFMSSLNLTEAQKTRIKAIHAKYEPQVKTLREQEKAQFGNVRQARQKGDTSSAARARFKQQREQFRQRFTTLRQQEENEVRGILTADQRAKWDAAQAQRKQQMEQMRKNRKNRGGQYRKGVKA